MQTKYNTTSKNQNSKAKNCLSHHLCTHAYFTIICLIPKSSHFNLFPVAFGVRDMILRGYHQLFDIYNRDDSLMLKK